MFVAFTYLTFTIDIHVHVLTHTLSGIPLAEPEQEVQWGGGYGSPSQDSGGIHCRKSEEALS